MIRLAFLLGLLCFAGVAHAQTRWVMPTEYPATAIAGEGITTFARLLGEMSRGQIVIEPSFNAEKGIKSAEMLTSVQKGIVPAGDAFSGQIASMEAVFGLSSLPFIANSFEDARKLTDLARPTYQRAFAKHGQRLLYTVPWPPTGIWSKQPLQTPDQLRSLAIRTYDATSARVMQAAGADAVNMPFVDAMPKLKDGSLNAVLSSGDGGAGRRLWEFLPYFTAINYAIPLSFATVNNAAYSALTEEARHAVDAAAAETEAHVWGIIGSRLQENYERMTANGVTIGGSITPELKLTLQRAAQGAVESWIASAGPDGGEIFAKFRNN